MNLMTAGRGIVHSGRTPPLQRAMGHPVLGLQSWIALPEADEERPPSFQHYDAEVLPTVEDKGVQTRIIAGPAFGMTAPVKKYSPWF